MSKPLSVQVLNKGPLMISGESLTLRYCGEPLEVEPGKDVYLCRCGQSKNAPYCDGTHSTVGISENPETKTHDVRVWEGNTIRTFFNPNVCMHVLYCKPLKELRKRELEGDAEAAEAIARVVTSCPSGALTFESKDVADPALDAQVDVDIIEGAEIRIQTAYEINADLGERQPSNRATLCRCGLSRNKPWCDGQHKKRDDFR